MARSVVLLSIPGLRSRDLGTLPRLLELSRTGVSLPLHPTSAGLACTSQASLITGVGPQQHGVVASSLYSRERGTVEAWPAWQGSRIEAAPLWETLRQDDREITSAAWFSLISKGAGADFACTPAPSVDPAGADEQPPCSTTPEELYGTLREALGPFPLKHFRGAETDLKSTAWIVDSFIQTAYVMRPRFSWVSIRHLDHAAQQFGPDSPEVLTALAELDMAIGALVDGMTAAGIRDVTWLVATEYCVTPVTEVGRPNRVLREAGLMTPVLRDGVEHLVPRETPAFAMVDHQIAHVFVREVADVARAVEVLRRDPTVADVLAGEERARVGLNHPRSGEIVLVARPEACFADDWSTDDPQVVLDATEVKGSHGQIATEAARDGMLVCSESAACFSGTEAGVRDVDVAGFVRSLFGFK